jgi:hypothetical protein
MRNSNGDAVLSGATLVQVVVAAVTISATLLGQEIRKSVGLPQECVSICVTPGLTEFKGSVGPSPVVMYLSESSVSGQYYYVHIGPESPLRLEGTRSRRNHVSLHEIDERGVITGRFSGVLHSQKSFEGTFTRTRDGKKYHFLLSARSE